MIKLGTSDMAKAYVGSTEVSKVYLGSELVWENGPAPLPYDAEIEYLQSSGTQYIQLTIDGVPSGTYFEVDIYFRPIYKNTNKYSIMSASPYQQFETKFYSYNSTTGAITYDSTIGTLSSAGGVGGGWAGIVGQENHVILSTTGTQKYDGTSLSITRPLTARISAFRIFGGYRNTNRYPVAFRKVKITAGNNVLYDLKAVRKDDVGYMYDTISGTLFGNNGSGSFTLGNDITV